MLNFLLCLRYLKGKVRFLLGRNLHRIQRFSVCVCVFLMKKIISVAWQELNLVYADCGHSRDTASTGQNKKQIFVEFSVLCKVNAADNYEL